MGLHHSRVYQEMLLDAGDVIGLCKSSTQGLTLRGDSAGCDGIDCFHSFRLTRAKLETTRAEDDGITILKVQVSLHHHAGLENQGDNLRSKEATKQ